MLTGTFFNVGLNSKRIVLTNLILWFCAVTAIGLFFTERNQYKIGGISPMPDLTCADIEPYLEARTNWATQKLRYDRATTALMEWASIPWNEEKPERPVLPEYPGAEPYWSSYRPWFAPLDFDSGWRTPCLTGAPTSTVLVPGWEGTPSSVRTEWIWPSTQWLTATALAVVLTLAALALKAVWSGGHPGAQDSSSTEHPQGE